MSVCRQVPALHRPNYWEFRAAPLGCLSQTSWHFAVDGHGSSPLLIHTSSSSADTDTQPAQPHESACPSLNRPVVGSAIAPISPQHGHSKLGSESKFIARYSNPRLACAGVFPVGLTPSAFRATNEHGHPSLPGRVALGSRPRRHRRRRHHL